MYGSHRPKRRADIDDGSLKSTRTAASTSLGSSVEEGPADNDADNNETDTIEVDVEVRNSAYRRDEKEEMGRFEVAMEYFYSTLEIGAEVALSSVVPRSTACGGKTRQLKFDGHHHYVNDEDDDDNNNNDDGSRNSLPGAEARNRNYGRASSSYRDGDNNGGGCLPFGCLGGAEEEDDDDNIIDPLPHEERIRDIESSLAQLDALKGRHHTDPFVLKMATMKQYLLLKQQRRLIRRQDDADRGDDGRKESGRARKVREEIAAKRLEIRSMKAELESMMVRKEDNRKSGKGRSSLWSLFRDGDDDDERKSEEGIRHAYRVFVSYTADRYRELRKNNGAGLWQDMHG